MRSTKLIIINHAGGKEAADGAPRAPQTLVFFMHFSFIVVNCDSVIRESACMQGVEGAFHGVKDVEYLV